MKTEAEFTFNLQRLITSRVLIQANSGGGKSYALRGILEKTFGHVQQFVFDSEGEFASLRLKFDYVLAAKAGGDVEASPITAPLLCRRLMELGASAILDLSELSKEMRREFVRRFLTELMSLPRPMWRPLLVVIDEAHDFAPERGKGQAASLDAVVDLCSRGRKRGFCAVLATQRISKLNKDAAAELLNKLIGRTGLDLDLQRAGDELGLDKDGRSVLKTLGEGEFFAFGPAISNEVRRVKTPKTITEHPKSGGVSAAPPPPPAKVRAMLAQLADLPKEAEEQERTLETLERENKELRRELRVAVDSKTVVEKPVTKIERVEVPVLLPPMMEALTEVIERFFAASDPLRASVQTLLEAVERVRKGPAWREESPRPAQFLAGGVLQHVAPLGPLYGDVEEPTRSTGLPAPQQRILDALASFEQLGLLRVKRNNVAVFAGQSPTSSGYANNLSALRSQGLIVYEPNGELAITFNGRAKTVRRDKPMTVEDLHDAWARKLPRPQWNIIRALLAVYPNRRDRSSISADVAQSPTSSGFANNLSALRSLGLLEYGPERTVCATALLFPQIPRATKAAP